MTKNVLIAGGTGMIGRAISSAAGEQGWSLRILTRGPSRAKDGLHYFNWDPVTGQMDMEALRDVQLLINLSGAGIVDSAWTRSYRAELLKSRVDSIETLAKGLKDSGHRPSHIICASAIGYFGDRQNELLDEQSDPGEGFLSKLTQQWEQASIRLMALAEHSSLIRIGLVLDKSGGFYKKMSDPLRGFVAPYFGTGDAWLSWIHIYDLVSLLFFCERHSLSGIFNGVSPSPVTSKDFMKVLQKRVNSKALLLPVPRFFIRIILPKRSEAILMGSKVMPKAALDKGFIFKYGEIENAINDLSN